MNNGARALEGLLARFYQDLNASVLTTGAADAYVYTANQSLSAYYDGMILGVDFHATNTGASTINVDGLGAKSIKVRGSEDPAAGDILVGMKALLVYDGTNFQLVAPAITASVSDGAITTAKIADNAVNETKLKDALIGDFTEVTVATGDSILLGDADDSGNTKRDTVQGILDLVPASGIVKQVLQAQQTGTASTTSATFAAITGLSQAITLSASSNKVLVRAVVITSGDSAVGPFLRLTRGGTSIGVGAAAGSRIQVGAGGGESEGGWELETSVLEWLDTPGSVGPHTYDVRWARPSGSGTMYLNRSRTDTNSSGFGRAASVLTLTEITA